MYLTYVGMGTLDDLAVHTHESRGLGLIADHDEYILESSERSWCLDEQPVDGYALDLNPHSLIAQRLVHHLVEGGRGGLGDSVRNDAGLG